MSKVDPAKLPLDRRTTLLLSASRAQAEPDHGSEKGDGGEDGRQFEDEIGIDSIRGSMLGLGALGSVYRARRSMAASGRRNRASVGSTTEIGVKQRGSSVGMERLERHRLYDSVRLFCFLFGRVCD
jgi:hypothetical protein